jgi:hypothetical protein
VLLRVDAPAPGLAHVLVAGERGRTTLQAALFGADAAAIAAREQPPWQGWMETRFPAAQAATRAG